MHAVVEIAGKQYKVAPKDTIYVPSLKEKVGSRVRFSKVLLVSGDKDISIGHPLVPGVAIEATVLEHGKGEKVIVFKKKRRKNYRVKRGHRQGYSKIEITNIGQ